MPLEEERLRERSACGRSLRDREEELLARLRERSRSRVLRVSVRLPRERVAELRTTFLTAWPTWLRIVPREEDRIRLRDRRERSLSSLPLERRVRLPLDPEELPLERSTRPRDDLPEEDRSVRPLLLEERSGERLVRVPRPLLLLSDDPEERSTRPLLPEEEERPDDRSTRRSWFPEERVERPVLRLPVARPERSTVERRRPSSPCWADEDRSPRLRVTMLPPLQPRLRSPLPMRLPRPVWPRPTSP